jgi:hypothetical protein
MPGQVYPPSGEGPVGEEVWRAEGELPETEAEGGEVYFVC